MSLAHLMNFLLNKLVFPIARFIALLAFSATCLILGWFLNVFKHFENVKRHFFLLFEALVDPDHLQGDLTSAHLAVLPHELTLVEEVLHFVVLLFFILLGLCIFIVRLLVTVASARKAPVVFKDIFHFSARYFDALNKVVEPALRHAFHLFVNLSEVI